MVWVTLNAEQSAALDELIQTQWSDRTVAILGGALLDDSIRQALELRLRAKDGKTDMNNKLFHIGGPLGNLQPKIDLGYQLYMLEKEHRNAMHGLAEIRNLFAHNLSITFADSGEKMKEAAAKLTLHDGKDFYPSPILSDKNRYPIEPVQSAKDKFIVNLQLCMLWLAMDNNKHGAYCNVPIDFIQSSPPDDWQPSA